MAEFRVWYSTESFADYIINFTKLSSHTPRKAKLPESDAAKSNTFHKVPEHLKKILYLDCPDLIVELDKEPIFSIEITAEAGTGHNHYQRFARIVAAAENFVPAFYICAPAKMVYRSGNPTRWDAINPSVFKAFDRVMTIYNTPALIYYYPSDYDDPVYWTNPMGCPHQSSQGLDHSTSRAYAGCPNEHSNHMVALFSALNLIIDSVLTKGCKKGIESLNSSTIIQDARDWMLDQYNIRNTKHKALGAMSPLTSTITVPTSYLLNYLAKKHKTGPGDISELLSSRDKTVIYCVNAKFRGDPYPGILSAIDHLKCRNGRTFEDREYNLVLCFGRLTVDPNGSISFASSPASINDFVKGVKSCNSKNLLTKDYKKLTTKNIPRYYMQVRYGSMYSKSKHIRVYSYFADAIIFHDGSLWRQA